MRPWIVLAAALGHGAAALAQTPPPAATTDARFALPEALALAARTHPALAAARARLRAASQDAVAAGLWTNPLLNAVYTRSVGFTTFDPQIGFLQVGVTQQLETAGVPGLRRRAAEFEREATSAEGRGARRDLLLDVHASVVSLAGAWLRREVHVEHLARLERGTAIIEARVRSGVAPDYDLRRAQLAMASARAALGAAEAALLRARTDLDVAVGPAAGALDGRPSIDLYAPGEVPSASDLQLPLLEGRADVAALRARARGASVEGVAARRSAFPGPSLYGGFAVGQGYGTNGERQVDVLVGVTLPMPFADRGTARAGAAAARAEAFQADAEAAVAAARRRAVGALGEVTRRQETLATFEQFAPDRATTVAEAEAAYRGGRVPIQGLIDAWEAVRDARLQSSDLAEAARLAEVDLWRAAARLPAQAPP
ncbi:MAG: TolC family protein [Deltaproteobacteria bacterium]|nr:TolC family protein [Deltaproteobacteria bacterium]